ncbi:reverse transcriptase [Phytophthora cinnamomi]|uniref:reverse transcriptase n=1 Tax=Phytophthora cinnamomi TaxID=4785 RepID=UPI003559869B|nr:reverse transcriptase [Phytophthora cinnamomi]
MENVTTSKSTKSSESKSARSVSSSDATGNVPAQRSSGKKRMKRKAGGEASDAVESSIVVIKSELSDDSDLGDWPAPPTKRRWEILGNSVSSSASVAVRTASGIQRSQTSPPSKPAALSGPEMQVRAPDPACAVSKATKSKNDGLRPDGERTVTRALRKRKARSQTWEDDDDDSSFVESTYRFARHAGENESDDEIVISGVIPAAPQPTMTGTLTRGQQTTLAQHGARLVKAVDSIPMVDQEESGSDTEREYKVYRITNRQEPRDLLEEGEPESPGIHSVLGRRSYIDNILIGGKSWDDLCEKVERLLDVYEQWHLSISVEKSGWGMSQVEYLGHNASVRGLQAKPKNVESLMTLEFPRPLKGLQAFLGSRNYYHRLIADFAVYATTLYSLTEANLRSLPPNRRIAGTRSGSTRFAPSRS